MHSKETQDLLNRFYINYEECKFFYSIIYSVLYKRFYINYEECKLNSSIKKLSEGISFILTMRNVNFINFLTIYYYKRSFILTMRNVNK